MPVITETERLRLRTWEPTDFLDAFDLWGNPEVMRYVGDPIPDHETARRTLERASQAQLDHGVSLWAVVEKASGEIVGACGFHLVSDWPVLELAYHIKPAHWRRGFATEAGRACVQYGVNILGAVKITAAVDAGNTASRRVLEKLGFHYDPRECCGVGGEEWFSLSPEAFRSMKLI
jgi:[ribosomal protein S5]-alanine N-acetyltransferase